MSNTQPLQVVYSEVEIGEELPILKKNTSPLQLFRYSAITWNTHRIHFDKEYALKEGYPNILVHSHLHGAFLTQLCTDWMGDRGELKSLEVNIKRFAIPGETLTCKGTVVEKKMVDGEGLVTIDLKEINEQAEVCAPGRAVIKLPLV
ncbi:acyl dehydratase [Lysinibacillus yapensis]|uniref:Acyl dehydratase n=1 Tax=Ureibacillus yapensis TaxID=2304605 RepID=A0A396S943_9BACL|nr:MaoC/PaaZ C-terminal domain-containing protein [Lysinibacillus yapensis]RHW37463.1 acyl dehydratase [Lysinibacillus yapensis]